MEVRKSTIDSLIYFYFGITLDGKNESGKTIIQYLAEKAFVDATNQGAFNTSAPKIPDEERTLAKNKAINQVEKSLVEYRAKKSREEFRNWHCQCCTELLNIYNDINSNYGTEGTSLFSYGNAQKLLNMTVKYVYLLASIECFDSQEELFSKIGAEVMASEKVLDIPIDSFIIQAFWEEELYDEIVALMLRPEDEKGRTYLKGNTKVRYAFDPQRIIPWSNWNDEMYFKVSDAIHEKIECPIQWECDAWIKISKKRKGWLK